MQVAIKDQILNGLRLLLPIVKASAVVCFGFSMPWMAARILIGNDNVAVTLPLSYLSLLAQGFVFGFFYHRAHWYLLSGLIFIVINLSFLVLFRDVRSLDF